jgi:hypothetical protein
MKQPSILKKYFQEIENLDGYGTCHIQFKRGPRDPKTDKEAISNLSFEVEILLPFTHSGEDLVAIGTGKHKVKTCYLVSDISDMEYTMQQGRMDAFKKSVESLCADLRAEMLKARPTTSQNRLKRKIRSLVKHIGADGLVQL